MATLRYYEQQSQPFIDRTRGVDMSEYRSWFTKHLPTSAEILDLGCGSGRDLKAFKDAGYEAYGLEPAKELAAHARTFSGCDVIQATVQEAAFDRRFDGVWACASLLHVPQHELGRVLLRVSQWVLHGGFIFASFKHGEAERFEGDRYYHDLTPATASSFFSHINGWDLLESKIEPDVDRPINWTHVLAKQIGGLTDA